MYFDSLSAALAMDGHGIYVWTAYIIAVSAIALILILPRRRERKFLRDLAGEIRRQQGPTDSTTGNS